MVDGIHVIACYASPRDLKATHLSEDTLDAARVSIRAAVLCGTICGANRYIFTPDSQDRKLKLFHTHKAKLPMAKPKLSIQLSLSPTTYHFSNPNSPIISLRVESDADRPITLFTWHTPLDPASALTQDGFVITDVANDTIIPQTTIRLQRAPLSRARGSGDEKCFLTLHPHVLTTVSTAFGRGGVGVRPQPRSVVERGWELDEQGNERKIRRSTRACGVDGLESGHRYRVDVSRGKLMGIWWRWGTKDDVLVDEGSLDWNLSSLPPEQAPLEVGQIDGVEFSVEE